MDFAQGLQFGSAWLVNVAFAGLLGVLSARYWLRDADVGAADASWASCATARARLDACWRPLALLCFAGQFAALWSAAATMAGLPPFDAFPALWMMLTATAFGKAGLFGLFCSAALALAGPLLLRGRSVRATQSAVVLPFESRRAANGGPLADGQLPTSAHSRADAAAANFAGDATPTVRGAPRAVVSGQTSSHSATTGHGAACAGVSGEATGDGARSPAVAARWQAAAVGLLAAFAAARVANSHAAENGLMTASMLIEWTHLVLVCLWLGAVTVAAWIVMPRPASGSAKPDAQAKASAQEQALKQAQRQAQGQAHAAAETQARAQAKEQSSAQAREQSSALAPVAYMRRLSGAATVAIVGILATGIYNAWHGLGVPANALGNPYGSALMVKVALVMLAAAMGGYNKLAAFPRAEAGDETALARARLVLQIESIVLAAAMLAAAVLVAQQPPAMA
ncbi:MAG TPA: CopD family protein [Pseudoduganella sp.]